MPWILWTALLAATPYGPFIVGDPVAPGLCGAIVHATVLALLIAWHWLGDWLEPRILRVFPMAFVWFSLASRITTLLLVPLGFVAVVNATVESVDLPWGLVDLIDNLEVFCRIVGTFGWCLYLDKEVAVQGRPPRFAASRSYFLGCAWPSAVLLAALSLCAASLVRSVLLSILVAVAVVLWGRHSHKDGALPERTAMYLVSGHLTSSLFLEFLMSLWSHMIFEAYYPPTIVLGYLVVVLLSASLFEAALKDMTKWRAKKTSAASSDNLPAANEEDEVANLLCKAASSPLTHRELDVMCKTALGHSAATIADSLGIAEATVASYRRRGYEKLGLSGASELRQYVRDSKVSPVASKESGEKEKQRNRPSLPGMAAFVTLMLTVIFMVWPDIIYNHSKGDYGSVSGICRFGLFFAALLILMGVIWAEVSSGSSEGDNSVGRLTSREAVLTLAHYLLFSVGSYFAWSSSLIWTGIGLNLNQYLSYRLTILLLLVLVFLWLGAEKLENDGSTGYPRRLLNALVLGVRRLFGMGAENLLFLAAALYISEWFDYYLIGTLSNPVAYVYPAAIAVLTVCLWRKLIYRRVATPLLAIEGCAVCHPTLCN
ncbi:MAG: hypothetical protein DBX94_06015 [Coriobacteriia bacterium]|nr:MAG: hypothetical protein DBX94_06015 [Coriobacteriia bacterium]